MKEQIFSLFRIIVIATLSLPLLISCTMGESENRPSVSVDNNTSIQKSEEELYEKKRKEAVEVTINIYNEILEDQ